MAKLELYKDFTVTATPTTFTCNLNEPYTRYNITTSGTVTIAGTSDINASGTPVEGMTLAFRYDADIAGGVFEIFGNAVPTELLDKFFLAEAYFNGIKWNVEFYPQANQSGYLPSTAISGYPGNILDTSLVNSSTIAIAGDQNIGNATIPADTFSAVGEGFKIIAWGTSTNNPAELKTIKAKVTTGATTINLYTNALTTDVIGEWRLEAEALITDVAAGELLHNGVLHCETSAGASSDCYSPGPRPTGYDETVAQVINITGAESTVTGGQITCKGVIVSKL